MKKIVALGVAAALVGGMAFADPASNPEVVSFNGNATVKWGVDLDAGKTGFKNDTWHEFKFKLFDAGNKTTSGEGVWGELELKSSEDWDVGGHPVTGNEGKWTVKDSYINVAKLHFNDFYVGISDKDADCLVGSYLFDAALRGKTSYAGNESNWVTNKGPADYTQGIVAGFDNNNLGIAIDFRSLKDATTQYTNSYAMAAEVQFKESNELVEGLFVDAGVAYQISDRSYSAEASTVSAVDSLKDELDAAKAAGYISEEDYNKALAELKTMQGYYAASKVKEDKYDSHILGYGAAASYKFKLDDKYFIKPSVAFSGSLKNSNVKYINKDGKEADGKSTSNANELAFGLMFGWGDYSDDNAGVYFLGDDYSAKVKKANPGASVVVGIPLPNVTTEPIDGTDKTCKTTSYASALAIIAPSVYTKNDFVDGLKAGFYSEIVPLRYQEKDGKPNYGDSNDDGTDVKEWKLAADKDATLALAMAAAFAYDIKADDVTITPKAGFRFANAAYVENGISNYAMFKDNAVFTGMGNQTVKMEGEKAGHLAGDFLNIKAGIDVDGAIPNTKFFAEYASANLLNKTDYSEGKIKVMGTEIDNPMYNEKGWYNIKLGTLNVGCTIHF